MYQLAARMGTKMAAGTPEDTGFHDVLSDVMELFINTHSQRYIVGLLQDAAI